MVCDCWEWGLMGSWLGEMRTVGQMGPRKLLDRRVAQDPHKHSFAYKFLPQEGRNGWMQFHAVTRVRGQG